MPQSENRYGATFPGEFFQSRELNLRGGEHYATADELWSTLTAEQDLEVSDSTTSNTLRTQTATDRLYFRGQADQGFGLSTSLHRFARAEAKGALSEELLGGIEEAILAEAASHGLDKSVSPGELLMILQHHAAPTRLLDVSTKPLEALYFAVESGDAKDGRLFVLWLNNQPRATLSGRADLPWTTFVRAGGKAAAEWTQSVQLVDETPLDPRMVAQQGRFLVGGIQRAYADLNMWYDKQLRVVERQAVSMLPILFPKVPQRDMPATSWPALGWTLRIPAGWKMDLRDRLHSVGISHDSMYPDLTNIPWRTERAARAWLGSRN